MQFIKSTNCYRKTVPSYRWRTSFLHPRIINNCVQKLNVFVLNLYSCFCLCLCSLNKFMDINIGKLFSNFALAKKMALSFTSAFLRSFCFPADGNFQENETTEKLYTSCLSYTIILNVLQM